MVALPIGVFDSCLRRPSLYHSVALIACVRRPQPRCGQVASRRTRESTRDQRPFRSPGDWGSTPAGPPNRLLEDVEHDRGEPPGSAALAARQDGHPRPEKMDRKKYRKV